MAGYVNRSISMVINETQSVPGPMESATVSQHSRASPPEHMPLSNIRNARDLLLINQPLKIFVLAKKKVNDIFDEIGSYVTESVHLLNSLIADSDILTEQNLEEAASCKEKVNCIREVLSRDHMKVVFFGRTSNGKSSVINAMLQDKILPSGIGHTTNCFLQVEGCDGNEAYLTTAENPNERKSVQSVGQLANALNTDNLEQSELVRIFWPKEKCPLLRDDVVLVDSPGIDVSPNLDEWIDKHCMDADVFVLVANAESTLMLTEKNFFHKVSSRISKPNIFILNNRWDASAAEPETLDKVRKQHMERTVGFLVDELNVVNRQQAEDRVFFVSAREVVQGRIAQQKGLAIHTGALAEGFQSRYFEFQDFERKFEECISKSAVKTKFEQHTRRGSVIAQKLRSIMEQVYERAKQLRSDQIKYREEQSDQLEFAESQLNLLTDEFKDKIRQMVEDVEHKVAMALNEEIRRLSVLVDQFNGPFHTDPPILNLYKRELHNHVDTGLGNNLKAKLSNTLCISIDTAQKEMMDRITLLLPPEKKNQLHNFLPRRDFEVLYRLNCDNLCADFQEDIRFRFSLGMTSIINNFMGKQGYRFSLLGSSDPIPRTIPMTPQTPHEERSLLPVEELSFISRFALASVTSQGAVGAIVLSGVLVRAIGWKVILVTSGIYGALYLYERLTWTNKAKEREFKRQYVDHATRKLKMIVDLTSANCSHQVQQELSGTFARLCHLVDDSVTELEVEIKTLDKKIHKLDETSGKAKIFRNKAGYLVTELNTFLEQYVTI